MSAGFRWNDADSLVGSFLMAVATGTFRVESFGDRQDLTRHLSGAGGHIQGQETLGGPLLAEAGWNRIVYAADGPAPQSVFRWQNLKPDQTGGPDRLDVSDEGES